MKRKGFLDELCDRRPKTFIAIGLAIIGVYASFVLLSLAALVMGAVWLWRHI